MITDTKTLLIVRKIRLLIEHNRAYIERPLARDLLYVLEGMVQENDASAGFQEIYFHLTEAQYSKKVIPGNLCKHILRYLPHDIQSRAA